MRLREEVGEMTSRISFPCPTCKAKLRASVRLAAKSLACPVCRKKVVVPMQIPAEQAPLLVLDDGHRLPRPQPRVLY